MFKRMNYLMCAIVLQSAAAWSETVPEKSRPTHAEPAPTAPDHPISNPEAVAGETLAELKSRVKKLLDSDDAVQRDWGVWLVAQHRISDLADDVHKQMKVLLEENVTPSYQRLNRYTDALYQNGYVPDPEIISLLLKRRYVTSALVLASLAPKKNQNILLDIVSTPATRDPAWIAACNFLVEMRSKKIAAIMLDRIVVRIDVTVHSGRFGGIRRAACRCADGGVTRQPGSPPVVIYSLDTDAERGDLRFTNGPTPVYLRRQVFFRDSGFGYSDSPVDRNGYMLKCLHELALDMKTDNMLVTHSKQRIQWKDAESYRKELLEILEKTRGAWKNLCDALVRQTLLPADYPKQTNPHFKITVTDKRVAPDAPLPEIDGWNINIQDHTKAKPTTQAPKPAVEPDIDVLDF